MDFWISQTYEVLKKHLCHYTADVIDFDIHYMDPNLSYDPNLTREVVAWGEEILFHYCHHL